MIENTSQPPESEGQLTAQMHRREKIARLTITLRICEGQELKTVLRAFSKAEGNTMRKVSEYWEIISNDNRGPIYEKNGIIRIRKPFKKWLK